MIRRRVNARGKVTYQVTVGKSAAESFDRFVDAEEYEATLRRTRRREQVGLAIAEKPNVTFAELLVLWEGNFAPSAWRLDMIEYSRRRWGKVKVRDIAPEAFGQWLTTLVGARGAPLSEKTRAHVLETARQVFNAGVEWGYLAKSPARPGMFKTPSPRKRTRPIRPFETWDEVLLVADACAAAQPVSGPLVRFVCATGLRSPGEWQELRWEQIDMAGRLVQVGSKTAAGHRTIPLSRHAIDALNDLPRTLSGRVFPGKKGGRFDYRSWREEGWRDALTDCGLEHRTPYEMRHTFATLALAHGASIDDVATVMGHENISVAFTFYRKWIRAAADRLRSQLDLIDKEDTNGRAEEARV